MPDFLQVDPSALPAGLPPIDLPQVPAAPAQRRPLQITVGGKPAGAKGVAPKSPEDDPAAFGFVPWDSSGAASTKPAVAAADDSTGFVEWPQGGAEPPARPPAQDHSMLDAAARGFAQGASFGTGPALAGVQAAGLDWMSPEDRKLFEGHPSSSTFLIGLARLGYEALKGTGGGATDAYRKRRDEVRQDNEDAAQQHPIASLAGEVVPALAMPLGAMGGATRLGRVAAQARAGAIGGAFNEAGSSLSRGESAPEIVENMGKGVLSGGAFGAVGGAGAEVLHGIGSRGAEVYRGMRNADDEASRRVADSLRQDFVKAGQTVPIGPAEGAAARAAGTPTAIVDFGGERTRALARSAANGSPDARAALSELTGGRFQEQAPRIGGYLRAITGGADAAAHREALEKAAAVANRRTYDIARKSGFKEIWTPELQRLARSPDMRAAILGGGRHEGNESIIAGARSARQNPFVVDDKGRLALRDLGNSTAVPDISFWDGVKKRLQDREGKLIRGGQNEAARQTTMLRQALVDELDAAVPQYKVARQGAAAFFNAEDALEAGQKFVMSSANLHDARTALAKMAPAERELFARGFASDLADKIERTGDRRNVLDSIFLNNNPARQKIVMALGPQRAQQFEALMRVETVIDEARKAVGGNSSTVRQHIERGMAGAGAVGAFEVIKEHDLDWRHLVAGALIAGALHHGAQRIDERVATRIGEMLASSDPSTLRRGIQAVTANPTLFNALRGATAAGVRLGGENIHPDQAAAAAATGVMKFLEKPPEDHSGAIHPQDQQGNY